MGGDAVAYTEPDADSIRGGLRALLDDPGRRQALGELEQARAREFTWAASAEAHMASYQRAAAQQSEEPPSLCHKTTPDPGRTLPGSKPSCSSAGRVPGCAR